MLEWIEECSVQIMELEVTGAKAKLGPILLVYRE